MKYLQRVVRFLMNVAIINHHLCESTAGDEISLLHYSTSPNLWNMDSITNVQLFRWITQTLQTLTRLQFQTIFERRAKRNFILFANSWTHITGRPNPICYSFLQLLEPTSHSRSERSRTLLQRTPHSVGRSKYVEKCISMIKEKGWSSYRNMKW